jgi:hypothetical protein
MSYTVTQMPLTEHDRQKKTDAKVVHAIEVAARSLLRLQNNPDLEIRDAKRIRIFLDELTVLRQKYRS